MREQRGDGQSHQADEQLDVSVRADQRLGAVGVPPIGPGADDVTAGAQTQHEDGDHDRARE